MSIDLSKATALSDDYGNIVQLELGGKVIWAVSGGKVILQVEKITSNTYAAETTYEKEQFILLDIYPKTNGTVTVTYGGLTKTITDTSGAEEPNAQQVFFGTFNGVSDSVATPASGELKIDGDCAAFSIGGYKKLLDSKAFSQYCYCITEVVKWGEGCTNIPGYAFSGCTSITSMPIPDSVMKIGEKAFYNCTNIIDIAADGVQYVDDWAIDCDNDATNVVFRENTRGIANLAFYDLTNFVFGDDFLPNGLVSIGKNAFDYSNYHGTDEEKIALFQSVAITIPATVEYIGEAAFQGPIYLANPYTYFYRVTVLATTPPTYPESILLMFGNVYGSNKGFTIIVPKGCGAAYKAATGWSEYADYIVEAS